MAISVPSDIHDLLDFEAARINNVNFIDTDPVQFPRRFEKLPDIEIMAFLSAINAWGNRKMICRDIEKLLIQIGEDPHDYVMEGEFENFPDERNIHRTFFGRHLKYFLRGLRRIYKDFGSIDNFATKIKAGEDEFPAWKLVEEMQKIMSEENAGETCSRCLPVNLSQTALKRINMVLRWLVRDDGIVDMGVWKSIPKKKLFIPMDVHVGNVSRELGLLERKANDRKSVEELTTVLRALNPEDPTIYDFALFGIGMKL